MPVEIRPATCRGIHEVNRAARTSRRIRGDALLCIKRADCSVAPASAACGVDAATVVLELANGTFNTLSARPRCVFAARRAFTSCCVTRTFPEPRLFQCGRSTFRAELRTFQKEWPCERIEFS